MFEDSTFESTGRIKTRSQRWMIATLGINGSILVTLVLLPLIYPEALPHVAGLVLMEAPPPPSSPPPLPKTQQPFHGTPEMSGAQIFAPPLIPTTISNLRDAQGPPPSINVAELGDGSVPGGVAKAFESHDAAPVVHEAPKGPIHISSTQLSVPIFRATPVYPAIARAAGVQGTVMLQATISKMGTIENLRVVNGSPMLQQAAMDAVKQWRYRPFLLNGEPVEVETTINVVFSLGR
jgi:periplasmic protein TonB